MSGSQGDRQLSVETYAVQGTREHDPKTGAVIPSIDVTTTYLRDPDNGYSRGFVYGRADNATVRRCEDVITPSKGVATRWSTAPAWQPRRRSSLRLSARPTLSHPM